MQGKCLLEMLASRGSGLVVTFKHGVDDKEGYAESGMRGRIVSACRLPDDVICIKVDYTEFVDHNRAFETANYFDKNGVPCLNAREAGYLRDEKEDLFVGEDEDLDFLEVESAERMAIYRAYKASGAKCSYIQWLEDKVFSASIGAEG